MIRAVLFDIGETLVYHEPPEDVHQKILADKGFKKKPKDIKKGIEKAEAKLSKTKKAGKMEIDEYYHEFDMLVLKHLGIKEKGLAEYIHEVWFDNVEMHLFDDCLPVLNRISAMGIRIGLVSNGFMEEVEYVMGKVKLDKSLFSVIVARDTTGAAKPDPRPFLHGAGSFGLRPDEVLFVGNDFIKDYEGSQGAGMTPVLILRGKKLPADAPEDITTIQTLDEIMNLIN